MDIPIDHLVYAAPTLEAGIAAVERRFGRRATPGGQHPAWGTRNALLGLGPTVYLEIIAPAPDLPPPAEGRPFGIDALEAPQLVTWALKAPALEDQVRRAARQGLVLGAIRAGRRRRDDGRLLTWRLTDPYTVHGDGLVPFLIDWGETEHPARSLPQIGQLEYLHLTHPEPDRIRTLLAVLDVDLPVGRGKSPALSMELSKHP